MEAEEEARLLALEQERRAAANVIIEDNPADSLEAATAAAQEALADAQAERDALIKEANEEAEQVIKKSKFSLKSEEEKAAELVQQEQDDIQSKADEAAAKQAAIAEGRGSSLSLAGADNYLNYENASHDDYVPGEGITGRLPNDSDEGSLTMGEEEDDATPELTDFEFKIRKLKIMLEHGLITEDEFAEMKKNLISNL